MDPTRRKLLKAALAGAGGCALRGAIPAGLLAAAGTARAAGEVCNATAFPAPSTRPQRLILITSAAGDPLNANVPGTYVDGIYHPPELEAGPVTLGATTHTAAAVWGTLPQVMRDRTCFFHHATYSNAHGDHAKVNALMGAIRRQELLVSLLAKNVCACGPATTQPQPVVLADVLVRYAGAVLPVLSRRGLSRVLGVPDDATRLALRGRRDADLTRLNDLLRTGASPAQLAALDRYAEAQAQARAVPSSLVDALADNTPGVPEQYRVNTAAVVLLAMNVTPVVVMSYDFGGDNHSDWNLQGEANATTESVGALADLWDKLVAHGLEDDVTIVLMNVFGRTLNAANRGGNVHGRDHNAAHHCTVLVGRGVLPGVVGGVAPIGNEFRAEAIDSATGAANPAGDVPYELTLASLGKTIGAAAGVSRAAIDDQITSGRYVEGALRTFA